MIQEGALSPSDLGAAPGDADWKPLSEWLAPSAGATPPSSGPPPMPVQPAAPAPAWEAPFSIDGKAPSGTQGKNIRQVAEEVAAGGRFVIYPYVVSIIILSFRRSSPITYIAPGKSGAGPAIGWSMLSMTTGWWGIPWGIFFTLGALWRNAAGGIDVTEPVLATWIGPQRADALLRQRPKRPVGGLWLLRGMIATPIILVVMAVLGSISGGAKLRAEEANLPGHREFESANQFMSRSNTTAGNGNTESAKEAGLSCAHMMQAWMDGASSDSPKNITAWCELHPNRVLFLVRIPDLRQYADEAKDEICLAAWYASQIAARDLELAPDAEIAVAVRGLALYDRMMTGVVVPATGDEDEEIEAALKPAIRKTDHRVTGSKKFAGYFVPPDA
jgi:hypothetical protein